MVDFCRPGHIYVLTMLFLTGNSRPSLADLHNHVIPEYSHHWKKLASNIGLPLSMIQTIEYSFPNSASRCCEKMFEDWLEQDIHASWEILLNAIDKIRYVAMPTDVSLGRQLVWPSRVCKIMTLLIITFLLLYIENYVRK